MGIYTASFNDLKDCDFGFIDEVWVIVRSLKNGLPTFWNDDGTVRTDIDVYHVPQLSPSKELFHAYLSWRDQGIWNKDTFEEKYVPQFLAEMHGEEQKKFLNLLFQKGQQKSILLLCYCQEEVLCHRSIILGLMQGVYTEKNLRVDCEGENFTLGDYSDYYEQYRKLDNSFSRNMQKSTFKRENTFYLLVAGTRTFNDYNLLVKECDTVLQNKVVQGKHIVIVEGEAKGADTLAKQYAEEKGYTVVPFPADWDKHGKSAGYKRNEQMHLYIASPTGKNDRECICFWDGKSRGTRHNFYLADVYKNPLRVYDYIRGEYVSSKEIQKEVESLKKENMRYCRV